MLYDNAERGGHQLFMLLKTGRIHSLPCKRIFQSVMEMELKYILGCFFAPGDHYHDNLTPVSLIFGSATCNHSLK